MLFRSPPSAAPQAATPLAPAASGPVVFIALAPDVWVKFYDGTGRQLLQKQLAQGEAWTVPADLPDVRLWTARPDALAVTIGGQPVAKISEVQQMVRDVPVTAAALLARPAPGAAAPVQAASPLAASPRRSPRPQPVFTPAAAPAALTGPAVQPVAQQVPAQPGAAATVPVNQTADR